MKHLQIARSFFSLLQEIGKAMMLPVAVLPIAGLLLAVGAAGFEWLPPLVSNVMKESGASIFSHLPLIFAIGTALGLGRGDGVAALSAAVGFVVLTATLGVFGQALGAPTVQVMGMTSLNTGIFGGIWIGVITAWIARNFSQVSLPQALGFFSGKRLIPILASLAAILSAGLLVLIWPPLGSGIENFSHWAAKENPRMAFTLYGFIERLLIPFGLHHIWNVPFFFQSGEFVDPTTGQVLKGEIARYIAGDPTAGNLAGGYLFKMWGLPAAALAIWWNARSDQKSIVGGIMLSAALTSFVTGITEPIEFSFMFLAPLLYLAHAVASAGAYFICVTLEIKHGMTFSHGLIDFILLYSQSSKALWFFVLGPAWAAAYFFGFTFMIRYFDLPTLGRGSSPTGESVDQKKGTPRAEGILEAFGGASNILQLDACITRLRVRVKDSQHVSEEALKKWGALHVLKVAEGIQAIFGTESENIKSEMEALIKTPRNLGAKAAPAENTRLDLPSEVFSILGVKPEELSHQNLDSYRTRIEIKSKDLHPFKQMLVGEKGMLVQISPRVVHWVKSSLDS